MNTLRRGRSGWDGRNFDADGFLAPLGRQGHLPPRRSRGRSWARRHGPDRVLGAQAGRRARVEVAARQPAAGRALAEEFGDGRVGVAARAPDGSCSSTRRRSARGLLLTTRQSSGRSCLAGRCTTSIYNPRETTLLAWAREAGAETIGGLEMLVGQAVSSVRMVDGPCTRRPRSWRRRPRHSSMNSGSGAVS